jgi:hypothetical protein
MVWKKEGVQEFAEFRSSGVQEFRMRRTAWMQAKGSYTAKIPKSASVVVAGS